MPKLSSEGTREWIHTNNVNLCFVNTDSFYLCNDCQGLRNRCKNPTSARPTPEAMAVDVFATVKQIGYSINVLTDYSQKMDRYAFLMIG